VIDRSKALRMCREHFPAGLERIVELCSVQVERSELCIDGWCFRDSAGSCVIRINSKAPKLRQRFTLAHEIAHLILGNHTGVISLNWDVYSPKSTEERAANDLAAELLLPLSVMREFVKEPLVDCRLIRSISRKAQVSEIAVALRIAKLGDTLGIENPTVIHLKNEELVWVYPFGRAISDRSALKLFNYSKSKAGNTAKLNMPNDAQCYASAFDNPSYPFLFYHFINPGRLTAPLAGEARRLLEEQLFAKDHAFRCSLNGRISYFKNRVKGMPLREAVGEIYRRYPTPQDWSSQDHYRKFMSKECYNYLSMRISEYT